jgi:hypothetical protein
MGFVGDDHNEILKYIMWRANNHGQISTNIVNFSYGCTINGRKYHVVTTPHRPFQFTLGQLSTMSTIYDNQGKGWNPVNIKRYFWSDNSWEEIRQQELLMMTTLHQFKKI